VSIRQDIRDRTPTSVSRKAALSKLVIIRKSEREERRVEESDILI
jgi:hypothetical protein